MTFFKTLLSSLALLFLMRAVMLGDVALALLVITAWTPLAFWWGLTMRPKGQTHK